MADRASARGRPAQREPLPHIDLERLLSNPQELLRKMLATVVVGPPKARQGFRPGPPFGRR
jgi:hypothetical protein